MNKKYAEDNRRYANVQMVVSLCGLVALIWFLSVRPDLASTGRIPSAVLVAMDWMSYVVVVSTVLLLARSLYLLIEAARIDKKQRKEKTRQ